MKLKLQRYSDNRESTLGLLYMDTKFQCYTLEDTFREEKIPGETRIDGGLYEITLRTEGGMHDSYKKRFPIHEGMLWLRNVTDFEYVYIHYGNRKKDTSGCILVGNAANNNAIEDGFISNSIDTYIALYSQIATRITSFDEKVFIEVVDEPYK